MSHWVYLDDDRGNPVVVPPFEEGGTRLLGGTSRAELNVTYNYAEVFSIFDWRIRDLHERRAGDTVARLEALASKLPNRPYKSDYWAPTPGNAGAVVHQLLAWARQHSDATWRIS